MSTPDPRYSGGNGDVMLWFPLSAIFYPDNA
jgi:hypothetical protein